MKNGVPTPLVIVMLASIDSTVRASPKSVILYVVCYDAFHSLSTFCLLLAVGDDERKEKGDKLCHGMNGWVNGTHKHISRLKVTMNDCYVM